VRKLCGRVLGEGEWFFSADNFFFGLRLGRITCVSIPAQDFTLIQELEIKRLERTKKR
jgi:hypothetical protein